MSENSQMQNYLKCPFRATLITRTFGCQHASEITRREGPDIGCDSEKINNICVACFSELKQLALPELGYTDDLTTMPASALQKVQYGGLLGLQEQVLEDISSNSVENIASLMEKAVAKYRSSEGFPYGQCLDAIANFKIKRRRGR